MADIELQQLPGNQGDIGLITLNRPHSINALNATICQTLNNQLSAWATDPQIKAVIIRGNGQRGFCAGGDLRYLYENRNTPHTLVNLFKDEYQVNHHIFHFPKPYISLLHGITFGGGVGTSLHGSHRIASPDFLFAMPETAIGFFPDVGASYFLSRLPQSIGIYLGLTGTTLGATEAKALGLIDHIIDTTHFEALIDTLRHTAFDNNARYPETLTQRLQKEAALTPLHSQNTLNQHAPYIQQSFSQPSLKDILRNLNTQAKTSQWASETAATLLQRSPISLKVTLEQLHRAATLDFPNCLRLDYTLAQSFLQHPNFFEGIRAAVIDKDRKPQWDPATLQAVTLTDRQTYFTTHKKDPLLFN